nr:hypothetical protein [Tanacetum cinerariifolium]
MMPAAIVLLGLFRLVMREELAFLDDDDAVATLTVTVRGGY